MIASFEILSLSYSSTDYIHTYMYSSFSHLSSIATVSVDHLSTFLRPQKGVVSSNLIVESMYIATTWFQSDTSSHY